MSGGGALKESSLTEELLALAASGESESFFFKDVATGKLPMDNLGQRSFFSAAGSSQ